MRIAKAILGSLLGKKPELDELSARLEEIYSIVSQLTYLLVLDDVWEADFSMREELLGSLGGGKAGHRILVTTHKKSVAAALLCSSEAHMFQLRPLSEERLVARYLSNTLFWDMMGNIILTLKSLHQLWDSASPRAREIDVARVSRAACDLPVKKVGLEFLGGSVSVADAAFPKLIELQISLDYLLIV
ncbi:unnamed protein product [Linum tenue]|uniref:NB-ARC domain-containing protein n=1 Tax=Linum tenue TaxID=586396 RepID=A0AAV0PRI9_9ROSI|nr:unnamed protein product [Linum tenue]